MWRLLVTLSILLAILAACGGGGSMLTTEQAATATAVSALATFNAQPADVKRATTDAVIATINAGLHK